MDLLDRYLQAVRFWLPRAHQNDIIEELHDDLRSRIEDKESALGRAITEDELAAVLQQAGHPMRVAARYQKQQSLIGPELFPLYKFVLMIVALGYLVPWVMVWLARLAWAFIAPASYRPTHLLTVVSGWGAAWNSLIIIFGMVTLAFTILERFQLKRVFLDKWDPRKLPRISKRKERVSRTESIFGLVFSIFFVVWWLFLPRFGILVLGHGLDSGAISLNPALRAYYLPILLPTLIIMAQQCINIFRPEWTWLKPAMMLFSDVIAFGIFQSIVGHYPYVLINWASKDAGRFAQAELIVNKVFLASLVCALVAVGIAIIVHTVLTVQAIVRLRKDKGQLPVQLSQML